MSPLHLALESGYFSSAGLDVQIETISTSSVQVVPLLAGGAIDVLFGGISPALFNAIARGARVRIVAAREIASPGCGESGRLYVRRDRFPTGLGDLSVLKGKRIAIRGKASLYEFMLDAILRRGGLRTEDVNIVFLDAAESITALLGGRIDGVMSGSNSEQVLSTSPQLLPGIGLSQIFPNFQESFIMFGKMMLDDYPDVGISFLKAYLRANDEFIHGKTPRFLEDYARSNNLDYKHLRDRCRSDLEPDGHVDAQSVRTYVDWAVDKGYCEKSVKQLEMIDTRFLTKSPQSGGGA